MRLEDITPMRESQLECFYLRLTPEQQDNFVLVEDAPDDMLLISYSHDNSSETIRPIALGLHAGTWPEGTVAARIDSFRFLSMMTAQPMKRNF